MARGARSKRWAFQPPQGVTVNWGHHLAHGLRVLIIFSSGTVNPIETVRQLRLTYTDTAGDSFARRVVRREGYAGLTDGADQFWDVPTGAAGALIPTDQGTVAIIRRKTDTTNRASTLFGFRQAPTQNDNVRCGAHVPYSDGVVYWDFGGSGAPYRLTVSGLSFTTEVERWVFVAGSKGSSIWRNGKRLANQTSSVSRSAETSNWALNGGNGINDNQGGDSQEIYYVAVLRAEWNQAQVLDWTANPFSLLAPPAPRVRYFDVPAVVAATVDDASFAFAMT